MLKLIVTVFAAATVLAPLAAGGGPAAVDPVAVTVTLDPGELTVAPRSLAAGMRTIVVRNRSDQSREFQLVRGGVASLVRVEGTYFLPEAARIVRSFGRLGPRARTRATLSLRRGDYVLVARSASAVVAAAELRVR
jgi:hypothetical protein